MRQIRVYLRWLFLLAGLLLLFGFRFTVYTILRAPYWSLRLFSDTHQQRLFVGLVALLLIPAGSLCLLTSWGMRRNRGWSRWTGIAACVFLLCGFPWLTPLGAAGLYFLIRRPPEFKEHAKVDFWDPNRQSVGLVIAAVIGWILMLPILGLLARYALVMGMPQPQTSLPLVVLVIGRFLYTPVHELGHAWAAWVAGFQLREIAIGPIVFRRRMLGWHTQIVWQRLLQGGGYVGGVPTSDRGLRLKEICIIAAGPGMSLSMGILLALAFFYLPGTPLAPLWNLFAVAAVMGLYDFAINLLPLGYTDGTMLLHLSLRTAHGEELLTRILNSRLSGTQVEDAERDLESKRAALHNALQTVPPNPLVIARAHLIVGRAELAAHQLVEAEQSYRKALEALQDPPLDRAIEADCQVGLHRVYLQRQRPQQAQQAYLAARRTIEELRRQAGGNQRLALTAGLAELHTMAREYRIGLAEITSVLLGLDRGHFLLYGTLLRLRAICEFQLGQPVDGAATAQEAARALRSAYLDDGDRMKAIQQLGLVGVAYSMAGRLEDGESLISECVCLHETHNARRAGARWRLVLAENLRQQKLCERALCALPVPDRTPADLRRRLVKERATILLRAGRINEAIADFDALLGEPADEIFRARVEGLMAEACLEAFDLTRAGTLAQSAYDTLLGAGHPDSAGPAVTLAILRGRPADLAEAQRTVLEAPLLGPASQARWLEQAADRIERAGMPNPAAEFRSAAAECRRKLGIEDRQASSPVHELPVAVTR